MDTFRDVISQLEQSTFYDLDIKRRLDLLSLLAEEASEGNIARAYFDWQTRVTHDMRTSFNRARAHASSLESGEETVLREVCGVLSNIIDEVSEVPHTPLDESAMYRHALNAAKAERQKKNAEEAKKLEQRVTQMAVQRTEPLGEDRWGRRYWKLAHCGDALFIESADYKSWEYIDSPQDYETLRHYLNPQGMKEKALSDRLRKAGLALSKEGCDLRRLDKCELDPPYYDDLLEFIDLR